MAKNTGTCVFCLTDPCFCFKPIKKTAPKLQAVKPPKAESLTVVPTPPVRRAGLSALPVMPTQPVKRAGTSALPQEPTFKDHETELGEAITALANAGMLHYSSVVEHYDLIALPKVEKDSLIWKSQHHESTGV